MKKRRVLFLILMLFIFVSCDNVSDVLTDGDTLSNITPDVFEKGDDEDAAGKVDEVQDEVSDEAVDEAALDEEEVADVDNGFLKLGEFALSYSGAINQGQDFQSWKGGEGEVVFTMNGEESTYKSFSCECVTIYPFLN